ncbi:uncharacterized protein LOC103573293 [Microplitis demolitor]|uniref:uncharacterized protein LOC103573293 n=1 Tax=Microplitis demolitor TaxID=69319 RepID=UPI0004CC9699|nr:uncharacterized protein LOC103573293 [Microplitis demolitor]XP_053597431.1 uncharacterized protein LOC103573293 [Microplitis demolitor]
MSDNEDDILEDIKALKEVLSQNNLPRIKVDVSSRSYEKSSGSNNSFHKFGIDSDDESLEVDDDEDDGNDADELADLSLKSVEKLLILCERAKQALQLKFEENLKRRQEVDYQIQLLSKGGKANWKVPYVKAGMPYFKDEKQFPAPKNEDTKKKEKNGELSISHLRRPIRWTFKDRNCLRIAIRKQAASDTFEKMVRESNENNDISPAELQPPKDLRTMVGPLGSREFDWMKISTMDMRSRHSPNECRVMWNILLHPDINDSQWKSDEEEMLKIKAREHGYQDWDTIARELNTGRTGYVCFIAFHRTLENTAFNDRQWSLNENEILTECVEKLRYGDFIPWGRVSTYINDRTKTQIYARWKYNLDPALKKGRFTSDEDDLLLDSVAKYGKNFPRISSDIMPHRSSVQLSGRFKLLMLKTNSAYNSWSVAEDRKLIQLFEEFGSQWSMISNIMKKDRTYLRHRYTIITRHLARGTRLIHIPRKRPIDDDDYEYIVQDDEDDDDDNEKLINNMNTDLSIDAQLMRYFQSIQAAEGKPGRKATYHTPDQLELRTKKLDKIFETLKVEIDIPDNLDGYNLSEKNKQLLTSYKEYTLQKSSMKPKIIEEYRQRMFGDVSNDDCREYFIPPGPFGMNIREERKPSKRRKKKADCSLEADRVQNLQIKLDMNLETPENVLKMLSDDEIDKFDKLSKLIESKCKCLQFPGRFEQAYVESIEQGIKSTKKSKAASAALKQKLVQTHEHDPWKFKLIQKDPFIPPCYSTLIGYQTLLTFKDAQSLIRTKKNDLKSDLNQLTDEGKKAFHLFKTRLHRLFKYPIIMSRLSPKDKLPDRTLIKEDDMEVNNVQTNGELNNENDETKYNSSSSREVKCEIKYDISENGQEQTKSFTVSVKLDK